MDAFWIVAGRVADWGALPADPGELRERTAQALRTRPGPGLGGWLPAEELAEARIVGAWIATNEPPALELDPAPSPERLARFAASTVAA